MWEFSEAPSVTRASAKTGLIHPEQMNRAKRCFNWSLQKKKDKNSFPLSSFEPFRLYLSLVVSTASAVGEVGELVARPGICALIAVALVAVALVARHIVGLLLRKVVLI